MTVEQAIERLNKRVISETMFPGSETDDIRTLIAEVERLRTATRENVALAAWACVFPDGKTGIVCDEGGSQYCAMERRAQAAEAERDRMKGVLRKIAETGLDNEGDGFADPDSLIILARQALGETQ